MAAAEPRWSDKKALLGQLQKLWHSGRLLREYQFGSDLFPKRLVFKSPDSKALTDEFQAVREWVADIRKLNGFRIVYKTVNHRVIGENQLPCEAWVDSLDTAVELLGKQQEFTIFSEQLALTRDRAPELLAWLSQEPLKALSFATVWSKLLDFVLWRKQQTQPGIYLRQVSLPGIDSKFIEQHRSVLSALLDLSLPGDQVRPDFPGSRGFEQRYGFISKPERIRFRILDPALALLPGADSDITLSAGDLNALQQHPGFIEKTRRVFITENEINFLAFPAQANSLIVFGAGYGFEALAQIDWLEKLDIFYWGDIDTHGFAILDQLRNKLPHVQSLLMDAKTLMAHKQFWDRETRPENRKLQHLTPDEQTLYQDLGSNKYQPNVRLEQERVPFDYVRAALAGITEN